MSRLRQCWDWFRGRFRHRAGQVYLLPEASEHPTPADAVSTSLPRQADSGHRERRASVLRRVGLDEVLPETSERWERFGNVMEGETVDLRVVSASSQVIAPEAIRTVCSVCGYAEDTELRSEVSQRTLCRTCARPFTLPDGRIMLVSPDEYAVLWDNYDTWAAFDHRRGGGR